MRWIPPSVAMRTRTSEEPTPAPAADIVESQFTGPWWPTWIPPVLAAVLAAVLLWSRGDVRPESGMAVITRAAPLTSRGALPAKLFARCAMHPSQAYTGLLALVQHFDIGNTGLLLATNAALFALLAVAFARLLQGVFPGVHSGRTARGCSRHCSYIRCSWPLLASYNQARTSASACLSSAPPPPLLSAVNG